MDIKIPYTPIKHQKYVHVNIDKYRWTRGHEVGDRSKLADYLTSGYARVKNSRIWLP